jgi:chromosomal replication initiation ATPase DnaA
VSASQFTLSLPVVPALDRADFVVAANNRDAAAWIDAWPHWPIGGLVLYGPPGAGKSHLAAAWAKMSGAAWLEGPRLTLAQVPLVIGASAYVIDDADQVAEPRALLHLLNAAREGGAAVVMTAREAPARWAQSAGQQPLADLVSRLKAMSAVPLFEADDELRGAILVKLFADRQIRISDDLANFLLARLDRSVDALRTCVELLDRTALAAGRRITIPFARDVLDGMAGRDSLNASIRGASNVAS